MGENKMSHVRDKSVRENSLDRISDLHDGLKEKILELLPLTDAINTSVLSRSWRQVWKGMQCLLFDESFFKSSGIMRTLSAQFMTTIIERILLLHHGSLTLFRVEVPPYLSSSILDTDAWFIILSRKDVQKIKIDHETVGPPFLKIPSYFFDCGRLRSLILCNCSFRLPSNFHGFQSLVFLKLYCIDTTTKEIAEFISHCSNLKTIFLSDTLEWYSNSEPLIVSAPNLSTFYFQDRILGIIILKNTPCLSFVKLEHLPDMQVQHKMAYTTFQLLCSLSAAKELSFDLPLLEPLNGDCPINLKERFVALKTLTLGHVNICNRDDIFFIFCLLRSSPNLKTLNISMQHFEHNDVDDEASVKCLEAEGTKGYGLSKLLNVKIAGITGLRCEIMLVNIILSNSALLKTLRIDLSPNINSRKELKMAWELNTCHRLSRDVKLMCFNSKAE